MICPYFFICLELLIQLATLSQYIHICCSARWLHIYVVPVLFTQLHPENVLLSLPLHSYLWYPKFLPPPGYILCPSYSYPTSGTLFEITAAVSTCMVQHLGQMYILPLSNSPAPLNWQPYFQTHSNRRTDISPSDYWEVWCGRRKGRWNLT